VLNIEMPGLKEARAALKDFSDRRFNAAVATALTRTAVHVRNHMQAELTRVFDKPTPYTTRQIRYVGASANRLVAAVGFNIAPIQDIFGNTIRYQDLGPGQTPAGKYLQFQIDGGQRRQKRFERALQLVGVLPPGWVTTPGERAKVDAFGNQSPGEIRQILSYFDAAELVAGSRQNMGAAGRARRMKGTRKTAGWEYFVARPGARRTFVRSSGGTGTHAMQPGIYRRTKLAMGTRIEPIVIFVKAASYRPRWNFDASMQREVSARLPREFDVAIQDAQKGLRAVRGQA
jgi:hypothetical protein